MGWGNVVPTYVDVQLQQLPEAATDEVALGALDALEETLLTLRHWEDGVGAFRARGPLPTPVRDGLALAAVRRVIKEHRSGRDLLTFALADLHLAQSATLAVEAALRRPRPAPALPDDVVDAAREMAHAHGTTATAMVHRSFAAVSALAGGSTDAR